MKKKRNSNNGIVYSTSEDFELEQEEEIQSQPAKNQPVRIRLDKKQRAGKVVTLITGFELSEEDLLQLGKDLKSFCGTGGSAKNQEIIIQGDHRQKVLQHLQKQGFSKSKLI